MESVTKVPYVFGKRLSEWKNCPSLLHILGTRVMLLLLFANASPMKESALWVHKKSCKHNFASPSHMSRSRSHRMIGLDFGVKK